MDENDKHKDPNGEEYKNPETGDKMEWNKGRPGQTGWKGKDHWHYTPKGGERGDHVPVGKVVRQVAIGTAVVGIVGAIVTTFVNIAPYWVPVIVF